MRGRWVSVTATPKGRADASAAISNAGVRGHRRSVRSLSGDGDWAERPRAPQHLQGSAEPLICESPLSGSLNPVDTIAKFGDVQVSFEDTTLAPAHLQQHGKVSLERF